MKKWVFFSLALAAALPCLAQDRKQYDTWALGVRVGEPMAINFRSYLSKSTALDVNVGLYGGVFGTVRNYGPQGRYRKPGLAINANYLRHFGLNTEGTMRGYYGLGGQINSRRSYPERLNGDYEKRLSLGPTAVAGFEYIQLDTPYSFFVELGAYVEALPVPLFFQPQGALGVRVKIL